MKWFGTAVLVGGALIISLFRDSALNWEPFGAFFLGHIVLIWDSYVTQNNPYVVLNASLACMDISAIWIRVLS